VVLVYIYIYNVISCGDLELRVWTLVETKWIIFYIVEVSFYYHTVLYHNQIIWGYTFPL